MAKLEINIYQVRHLQLYSNPPRGETAWSTFIKSAFRALASAPRG